MAKSLMIGRASKEDAGGILRSANREAGPNGWAGLEARRCGVVVKRGTGRQVLTFAIQFNALQTDFAHQVQQPLIRDSRS